MYVQRAKNENCEGCEKSWSSQRDHSCLMHTTDELCERYFDAAYTRLNAKLVGAVYGFDGKNPGMMLDNFQDYKKEKSDMFRKKLGTALQSQSMNHLDFYQIIKMFI